MGIKQSLLSSIGQKLLLATSGLIMFLLFLIPHMGGNVLFLFGPDIFNSYAHHLHQLVPIVIGIEILMLVSISIHMIMAFRVVLANRAAADKRLTQKSSKERSLAAKLMPISGIMIFIFIVKHLLDFKFYEKAKTMLHGVETYDVYAMVLGRFQDDPIHLLFYVGFMIAVGFHLSHALQSSLQTYGLFVPREGSRIKLASVLVGWGMAATFAVIPIAAFIK
ncbi:MAG: succinate dehydrogenase cytochrome b subunit [Pontiella sp.]|nr:succinate dehydrogenase cytochrome b subunit [Pontiella sp.]MBT8045742.1 succinate dehydrogenase cytochrome b subunit [Pontiella sp.]NNJ71128.1 succinate dehydrogenase cytochrome b subunit [Kiritimatiellales bacterium]